SFQVCWKCTHFQNRDQKHVPSPRSLNYHNNYLRNLLIWVKINCSNSPKTPNGNTFLNLHTPNSSNMNGLTKAIGRNSSKITTPLRSNSPAVKGNTLQDSLNFIPTVILSVWILKAQDSG